MTLLLCSTLTTWHIELKSSTLNWERSKWTGKLQKTLKKPWLSSIKLLSESAKFTRQGCLSLWLITLVNLWSHFIGFLQELLSTISMKSMDMQVFFTSFNRLCAFLLFSKLRKIVWMRLVCGFFLVYETIWKILFQFQNAKTVEILFRKTKNEEKVSYKISALIRQQTSSKITFNMLNVIELKLSTLRKVRGENVQIFKK